jgi:6-phosphofructokinase
VGQWCWWRGVVVMAAGRGCGWLCCTCGMAMGVDDDSVLEVAVVRRRRSCGVVHIHLYVLSTNN